MQLNFLISQILIFPSISKLAIYVECLIAITPINGLECPLTLCIK